MCDIKITFKDQGQDFLTWTIKPDGTLIECEPFQFSIWSEYVIRNPLLLEPGDFVSTVDPDGDEFVIKYPIEKVEHLKNKEVKNAKSNYARK